jgi:hypothetical protein
MPYIAWVAAVPRAGLRFLAAISQSVPVVVDVVLNGNCGPR